MRPLLIALAFLLLTACERHGVQQRSFLQFGTLIDITLSDVDRDTARQSFDEIESYLRKRHSDWHGWQPGVLNRFNQNLNQHPKVAHVIPEELKELISLSGRYHRISGGLFNPAMGRLISAWGFHASETPDYDEIERIRQDIPLMTDLIVQDGKARSTNPELQLDFGAIAKGLAVKEIGDSLVAQNINHFIINAGGDVFSSGNKSGKNWRIAIENPFQQGIIAGVEMEQAGSIFTSGNYRRFYIDENQTRRHHIIDPYTGEPAKSISSATVLHQSPVIADIAATTLMMTSISELATMAAKMNITDYLVITENHEAWVSPSMAERIEWLEENNLTIKTITNSD